jgi:IclR family pca regulon transcriptional regulator
VRALSVPGPGQRLADVARATGLTRAAARRFLLTLQSLGYVRNDGRLFSLTPRVLELGFAYLSSLELPEIAQPHLQALVEQVHESSSVSVLDGDEVVYVARVPAQRRIMAVTISVGTRFPAFLTSMGRVLLAGLADGELDALHPPATLRGELARVRAAGHAIVDQELEAGLRSVAAPIRDPRGRVIAAVNLSAHASRRTLDDVRTALLPPLLETAAAIERDLSGAPG